MARESACDPIASTRTLRKTQIHAPPTRPSAADEKTRSTRLRPSSRTSASRTMRVSLLVLRQLLNTTVGSVTCQAADHAETIQLSRPAECNRSLAANPSLFPCLAEQPL